MVWALWSSAWRWNFWRMVSHPFNSHEKRLFACFSSWPELKRQLQCKAHIWMVKVLPVPVNSKGYRVSAVYFPSFHTELLTEGRATHSVQKCQCQMKLGISVEALQRMPKELEHECESGRFSLITCLWHAWRVILSLQHFIRFLNFPFLRNPARSPALQLPETSCTHP